MAVMSMISVIVAMVPVVMSLVSMVLVSMIFVSVVLRYVVAVVFMPAILRDIMAMVFAAMIFMRYVMAVIVVTIISSAVVLTAIFTAFFSGMVFTAILAPLFANMVLAALFTAFLIPLMRAIRHFMSMVLMPVVVMLRVVTDGIRMVIFVAVHPCALPRRVIDEHHATVPGNTVITPSPGTVSNSQRSAKAEANCAADEEARARPLIDHNRIVCGNHNVVYARRHDRNIRSAGHDDLRASAQVAIVARALAHSLYRVHHFLLLAQKSVAQIGRPVHVRSHHVQHGRKGKQRLHGRVPGQLIVLNGVCQFIAGHAAVLVRPVGCVGNLVRKSCRGQRLRQQRIGIQRNARHHAVKLRRRKIRRVLRAYLRRQRAAHHEYGQDHG